MGVGWGKGSRDKKCKGDLLVAVVKLWMCADLERRFGVGGGEGGFDWAEFYEDFDGRFVKKILAHELAR